VPDAHVLVVDDEPDIVDLLELELTLAGYRVTTARDGEQALRQLRCDPPDLVVLDLAMPQPDGWQVLATLQDQGHLRRTAVVVLTGLDGERLELRARLCGAVDVLGKPIRRTELLDTLATALAPRTPELQARRREALTRDLQRLAELEAGRERRGPALRLSALERPPTARRRVPAPRPAALTARQREIAARLAEGRSVRSIADELGTSRANVYATRARIARALGCEPGEVGAVVRRSGATWSAETA
jgi:FixJ family two-component response regulator